MTVPARGSGRTLTESLRHSLPDSVITLLGWRPDLSLLVPRDLADLTTQATTPRSVARALDGLNAWQRQAAEGLSALPDPSSVDDLAELLTAQLDSCRQAVDDLRQRALLWGPDQRLHLVRAVREQFGPYPGALASPSPRPLAPERVAALVAECDAGAREVLQRLAWSPTGALAAADRNVSPEAARGPVEQLLARRLLLSVNAETVILPREVAWHVRGGRFTRDPVSPEPPGVSGRQRKPELIDRAAAGAAYGLVHDLELTGHTLDSRPHRLLRDGGLGQRDLTALARELGRETDYAGFLLECGAASVFAPASDQVLRPTRDFDSWTRRPPVERWLQIAQAWRTADRLFSRSLEPDSRPLGPEADIPYAVVLRRLLLELTVEAETAVVPDLGDLAAAVRWHRPRLGRVPLRLEQGIGWFRQEAAWLGLAALDATSSLMGAVLNPEQSAPEAVRALFPEPVETIIVQADLTAVAAGPLPYQLAADLRLLADQESRGGGGVYRFSSRSLRRALDAGWSADRMRSWLQQHSSTRLPQPLSYLIDDVARHHGSVRVGPAETYIGVDDPVRLAALLADPGAAALGLRQIGSDAVVAQAQPDEVLRFLERLGHHPALDRDFETGTEHPAARAPTPERVRREPSVDEVAAILLAGEATRTASGRSGEDLDEESLTSTVETLDRLRAAVRAARPISLRLVTADGEPAERRISPLDLSGGQLRGVDLSSARVVTIPLARVLFASEADSAD